MSTTLTMTTPLNTSNVRGPYSRQTRSTAPRASRAGGSSLRQNSLVSNSNLPLSSSFAAAANAPVASSDPPGMCMAITHFSDAIAALPRDYRRHTSLLKEVDAKAWAPEENLQTILDQCLKDTAGVNTTAPALHTSHLPSTAGDDPPPTLPSAANSVAGASADNVSIASLRPLNPAVLQRRQEFAGLRHNLMAIMVTMDEKNHVINNANEEVARHIRRMDRLWPHLADEISEDSRLGSLKHWAYTETVPTKKKDTAVSRRDAAPAGGSNVNESDAAHRSESRREAVMARRQRANPQVDSDFDESRLAARRAVTSGKKRVAEPVPDPTGLGISVTAPGKRKRAEKSLLGGAAMERSISSALGGRPMSRDNSQQDNSKKRKASSAVTTVARKRLNATAQESPKLASSPLAGNAAKEAYKRSPALSSVRPVNRGRQNSTQTIDSAKGRPSSSSAPKNESSGGGGGGGSTRYGDLLTTAPPPAAAKRSESKNVTKENESRRRAASPERDVDEANGEEMELVDEPAPMSTRQNGTRGLTDATEATPREPVSARPLLSVSITDIKSEKARGRASKTSTPVMGTFAEADAMEVGSANGNSNGQPKLKRPSRPRPKDHGLHDSLSPKGLPQKRSHKKSGSLSVSLSSLTGAMQRFRDETTDTPHSGTPSDTPLQELVDDEDDDTNNNVGGEEDEARYCYCNGVSYGEMLACDNEDCKRQWFHLDCLGLKSVPKTKVWYCEECREKLARQENGGKKKNGGK